MRARAGSSEAACVARLPACHASAALLTPRHWRIACCVYLRPASAQACSQEALSTKTWEVAREAMLQLHSSVAQINDAGAEVRLPFLPGM